MRGTGNGIPLIIQDISAAITGQTAGYIGMSTSAFSGQNGDLVLYPRTSGTHNILLMGGNVGIGTGSTAPSEKLDVYGNIKIGTTANSNFLNRSDSHWIQYNGGATTNDTYMRVYGVSHASSAKTIGFYTDNSPRLTISSGGDATFNSQTIDVKAVSAGNTSLRLTANGGTAGTDSLDIINDGSNAYLYNQSKYPLNIRYK